MITIRFKDESISIASALSLSQLLLNQGYVEPYFAVAVNKQFVPRSSYAGITLADGDVVDLIMPMQGG